MIKELEVFTEVFSKISGALSPAEKEEFLQAWHKAMTVSAPAYKKVVIGK